MHEIKGGQVWLEVIEEALWQSSHVILLLSKNSTSKWGFIQKEIRLAIEAFKRVPPGDVFLIPCRLEPCQPRYRVLRELHWIDLFPSFESGFQQLLRALDVDVGEAEEVQRSPRNAMELRGYRLLFDRPAFSVPCIFERAVPSLVRALDDISAALATGTYYSRAGKLLRNIVPVSMIEDEKVRESFAIISNKINLLQREVHSLAQSLKGLAVANNAPLLAEYWSDHYMDDYLVKLYESGVSDDNIRFLIRLMDAIDDSRNQIITELNKLFGEAGISRIPPVRRSSEQIAFSETLNEINLRFKNDMYGLYYVANWRSLKPLSRVDGDDL
jgi:hypothetical protein